MKNLFLRALGLSALVVVTVLVLAFPAQACPPKWSRISGTIETATGTVEVTINARPSFTRINISAQSVEQPQSGEFRVLLQGSLPEQEIASFSLVLGDSYEDEFVLEEDLRSFLMEVDTLSLRDGQDEVGATSSKLAGGLRLRAKFGVGGEEPLYRFKARFIRRSDGTSRFKMAAVVKNETPLTTFTFRLQGENTSQDLEVVTDESGAGRLVLRGRDDYLAVAAEWEEVVVFVGSMILERFPLECR